MYGAGRMRRRQGAAVEGGAGIGEGSMREEGESVAAGDGLGWRRFFFVAEESCALFFRKRSSSLSTCRCTSHVYLGFTITT